MKTSPSKQTEIPNKRLSNILISSCNYISEKTFKLVDKKLVSRASRQMTELQFYMKYEIQKINISQKKLYLKVLSILI
jgi:hypothetical protein